MSEFLNRLSIVFPWPINPSYTSTSQVTVAQKETSNQKIGVSRMFSRAAITKQHKPDERK